MYRAVDRESGNTLYQSSSMDLVIAWANFRNNLPENLGFGFRNSEDGNWQRIDYHFD